jgi:hypothetical protein
MRDGCEPGSVFCLRIKHACRASAGALQIARTRCIARLEGYRLAFSKKSDDESGKATVLSCSDSGCRVFGVVYDLDESDLEVLDRFEGAGKGYHRVSDIQVRAEELQGAL